MHGFKEGHSKKQQGPKRWFKQKQPMAFVKRKKSPSPSKCDESSDGYGEEGMMNMVGHTRNQNEPNVVTTVETLGVHGVIISSKQYMARDARFGFFLSISFEYIMIKYAKHSGYIEFLILFNHTHLCWFWFNL